MTPEMQTLMATAPQTAEVMERSSLKLVEKTSNGPKASPEASIVQNAEGISYLLKALAFADAEFSADIENALVQAGEPAVASLLAALESPSNNVRSIAAMVLIRLGSVSEAPLVRMYSRLNDMTMQAQKSREMYPGMGFKLNHITQSGVKQQVLLTLRFIMDQLNLDPTAVVSLQPVSA